MCCENSETQKQAGQPTGTNALEENFIRANPLKTQTKKPLKKLIVIFVIIAVAVASVFVLVHKSDEDMIIDCINNFAAAYNEGDSDKLIDCLDKTTQAEVKAYLNIGSSLLGTFGVSGVDSDAIWSLWSAGARMLSDSGQGFNIKIYKISFTDKTTAEVDLAAANSKTESEDRTTFTMVKESGKWYIKDGLSLY